MDRRQSSIPNHAIELPAPTGREHLKALAGLYGVKLDVPKEKLIRPLTLPQYATAADREDATKLLAGARRANEKFKDPSKKLVNRFKSQSKKSTLDRAENWEFSWEERASLLEDNIRNNSNIGLAQALLEYRGDNLLDSTSRVNSAVKVVNQLSKVGVSTLKTASDPDEWLAAAVSNKSIQHVILLASRQPSQASLNRAFEAAISLDVSIAIIEELLRYGVDVNEHSAKLPLFVSQNRAELIEAYLRSPRTLQPVQLNSALAQALEQRQISIAAMLLVSGADPNYAAAQGFLDAVREAHLQTVLLLLVSSRDDVRIRLEYLDHAVSLVINGERRSEEQQFALLDALIAAGAGRRSKALEQGLFEAVSLSRMKIVKLLTRCGISTDHEEARCVRASLELQDLAIFDLLLHGRSTTGSLSKALPQAMVLRSRDQRLHAVTALLQKGASGPEVSGALILAIEQEDYRLFSQLMASKADPNAFEGRAYEAALRSTKVAYLERLCADELVTFQTAARIVPIALQPGAYHQNLWALIFRGSKAHTAVLNKALVDEVAIHGARHAVITLLQQMGASVDTEGGAAVIQAAAKGQQTTVELLLTALPSHSSLQAAFEAAMALTEVPKRYAIMKALLTAAGAQKIGQDDALVSETRMSPTTGTGIVTLLLNHNASVDHQGGAAIKIAITTGQSDTVRCLLTAHPSQETLIVAFTQAMTLGPVLRVLLLTMLAEEAMHAAIALPVGLYLNQAITENDSGLVKLLLHYGADPNQDHGRAYIEAAHLKDTQIFEELLVHRPELKRLLPALVRELEHEDQVVACLKLCFERMEIQLNSSENVLLFLALDQFEEGVQLIKFLLDSGCSPGVTRDLQLREHSDIESVTPLIWALSRPLPGPSKAVLAAILDKGQEVKPDYVTPVSKTTALLEAARSRRHTILTSLLALGAKVNSLDADGNSALRLTSESGNLASVTAILQARVRPNDGSLHAAARGAHEQIVQLLLDHGHTPNHIYAGRSALAELCRHGYPDGNDWAERAYWVVDVLIKRGTNIDARFLNKNLLHLALDNDMPMGVLKILLDFPQFSEHLNDESFLYEDAIGTVYSPTSYAETFYHGSSTERERLVRLLEDKNCPRNMWNRQGRHPPNYTYSTMPAHLKAMVDQEKIDELKMAKELQRRQEQARIERELADRNHKHLMDQAAARHRHELLEAQQREAQQAAAEMRRQEAEKRHKRDLATAEAQSLREKHQLEVNQQAALAMQRQQIEDRDRVRAHRHQQQMNGLELERTTNEGRVNDQQHIRQLQLLDRQDQSIRIRAEQMRSVAQAAQHANANVGLTGPNTQPPKQIGFGNEWATVD